MADEPVTHARRLAIEVLDVPVFERDAWLRERCGRDLFLAERVRELVRGYYRAEEWLSGERLRVEQVFGAVTSLPVHSLRVEDTIGDWSITELVHGGGMSEVYAVRRAHGGFEQEGVLKLLPDPEATGGRQRKGFERERQFLAGLRHAAIAPLIDGGSLGNRPFIVTERAGRAGIVDYCNSRAATMQTRLRLFLEVCDAIEFAHAKGIAHCDIKPNNVLVGEDGHVRVVDFGIARLAQSADSVESNYVHLTPAYASPEQKRGHPGTKKSDIYSLGVLLVELVSGHLPSALSAMTTLSADGHDMKELMARAAGQSTAAQRLAAERQLSVEKLCTVLSGRLNEVAAQALEEGPDRRYASVGALASAVNDYQTKLLVDATLTDVRQLPGKLPASNAPGAAIIFSLGVAIGAIFVLLLRLG